MLPWKWTGGAIKYRKAIELYKEVAENNGDCKSDALADLKDLGLTLILAAIQAERGQGKKGRSSNDGEVELGKREKKSKKWWLVEIYFLVINLHSYLHTQHYSHIPIWQNRSTFPYQKKNCLLPILYYKRYMADMMLWMMMMRWW